VGFDLAQALAPCIPRSFGGLLLHRPGPLHLLFKAGASSFDCLKWVVPVSTANTELYSLCDYDGLYRIQ
jgi:hypothetical protein